MVQNTPKDTHPHVHIYSTRFWRMPAVTPYDTDTHTHMHTHTYNTHTHIQTHIPQ